MPGWAWRGTGGAQEGLTVYQLQELVRSGRAHPGDEVRQDGGPWTRVADEPRLARLLPEPEESPSDERHTLVVNGVVLELGPDGKPLPPSPEQIARMLSQSSDREERTARVAKARQAAFVVAAVLFAGAAFLLFRILTAGGGY